MDKENEKLVKGMRELVNAAQENLKKEGDELGAIEVPRKIFDALSQSLYGAHTKKDAVIKEFLGIPVVCSPMGALVLFPKSSMDKIDKALCNIADMQAAALRPVTAALSKITEEISVEFKSDPPFFEKEKDLATRRNDIARLFKHSSKIHRNCIRLNPSNSYEHEMEKARICWGMLKNGVEFLTEAEFEGGLGRADIVNLDLGEAIEIVHTESGESIAAKRKKYPLPIMVLRI